MSSNISQENTKKNDKQLETFEKVLGLYMFLRPSTYSTGNVEHQANVINYYDNLYQQTGTNFLP